MQIAQKTPEEKYNEILELGDVYSAIMLIKREIDITEEIYEFIKQCTSEEEFNEKIYEILEKIKIIRKKKLNVIKNSIKFHQFKRKYYYTKLYKLISDYNNK